MSDELKTGVYQILNLVNGKCYVGSAAISFKERWRIHKIRLGNRTHHCLHLQSAWHKFGKDSFQFRILEICAPELCVEREQFWIDHFESSHRSKGYNATPTAGSQFGYRHRDEAKAVMRDKKIGRKLTEEHRRKIGDSLRGRIRPAEVIEKMRLGQLGKKHSDEAKAKMRGRKMSVETRAIISAANKNRGPCSMETRRKLSQSGRGKRSILTEEIVRTIRSRHESGESGTAIGRDLEIKKSTVFAVIYRANWTYVV